ncbi:3'-5' exonuclease, partial [Vibrio parahaemolyticus]
LKQQAILCRTNAQCETIAGQLEARGVPTQHLGGLFDRDEVRDLLALLSLACEPGGMALIRVAAFPEYAIPRADALRL